MAQGVALVRAAEKSSAIYMLSENYPFMKFNQEMRRIYRGGSLGKVLFAEGEYNHPLDPANSDYAIELCPTSKHWRYNLPRTYYITHSLAPLMYITGAVPKRVTAMPVYYPVRTDFDAISRGVPERAAIITTLNDDDSVFRVTGCAAFGAHENSYRICAEKGQVENLRDGTGRVLLNYNKWDVPEDVSSATSCYVPMLRDKDAALAAAAGHGGGDFFVIREFLNCIRENKRPEFDVYFGTTMASVAILGHRSMLENGVPYDIPDFRKEEDRVKYENDNLSPFYGTDGTEPTIAATSRPDYWLSAEGRDEYDRRVEEFLKARRDNEA
jgi:predicted dehydrogenase